MELKWTSKALSDLVRLYEFLSPEKSGFILRFRKKQLNNMLFVYTICQ